MSSEHKRFDNLFEDFPPVSKEEWESVIRNDLDGADYRKALRWKTGEGIEVLPFYCREDLEDISHRSPVPIPERMNNRWDICQAIFDRDIEPAGETAANAVESGADSLQFKLYVQNFEGMLGGDMKGTSIQSQEDFGHLLASVPLDESGLHFDSSMATPYLVALLYNEIKKQGIDSSDVFATYLYDPYAYILASGHLPKPERDFINDAGQVADFCREHLPGVRCLGIDARIYRDSGATLTQELGYALAAASEYLAKLTDWGLPVDDILSRLFLTFSTGSHYFLEIAKYRAARLLWSKLVNAYHPDGSTEKRFPVYIRAETSTWNNTIFDPYTNVLRHSTEGMAAALAGCDSVTVHPYDRVFKRPDEFSQRIARNTQVIFREEAHLGKVRDPAAGSYYIETLTDKVAEEAWNCFRDIEKQGGIFKAIREGYLQWTIEESRRKKDREIAFRDKLFVGTNQYPNPEEHQPEETESAYSVTSIRESDYGEILMDENENAVASFAKHVENGALLGDLVAKLLNPGKHDIRPIRPYRGAEAFEELRMATEKAEQTPTVLLLPIGDPRKRKARSTFASNFFGCAGYRIEDPIGFDTVEDAAKAVTTHDPDIAVICSSDREYGEIAEPLCRSIREKGSAPIMVIAGKPGNREEQYRNAGVDRFIYSGMNVLETLREFQQHMGII